MQSNSPDQSSAGFTLLELLAVIGVVSVLLGIGLGYLGKTDPMMVANSILAGERRAAQMTARAEGVPTEVLVRPGTEVSAATVQARLLEPAITFHFEPDTPVLDERMRPAISGDDVVAGRFGHARRSVEGDKEALLEWLVSPQVMDVREGFLVRVDLYMEQRDSCVVLDMQPLLEVRLDSDLRPDARVRLGVVGGGNELKAIQSPLSFPLRQWATLEIGCDGSSIWLSVDDREHVRVAADGAPHQAPDMVLEVSPLSAPVPGVVDELRLMVFGFSVAQQLPMELQPMKEYRFTYDKRGDPVEVPEIIYQDLEAGL